MSSDVLCTYSNLTETYSVSRVNLRSYWSNIYPPELLSQIFKNTKEDTFMVSLLNLYKLYFVIAMDEHGRVYFIVR